MITIVVDRAGVTKVIVFSNSTTASRRYLSYGGSKLFVMVSPDEENSPHNENKFSFRYPEGEQDQPVSAVIEAVAWVKNVDVIDLEPISHVIDTDAMNDLLNSIDSDDFYRSSRDPSSEIRVIEFNYEGCTITLKPGEFTVRTD